MRGHRAVGQHRDRGEIRPVDDQIAGGDHRGRRTPPGLIAERNLHRMARLGRFRPADSDAPIRKRKERWLARSRARRHRDFGDRGPHLLLSLSGEGGAKNPQREPGHAGCAAKFKRDFAHFSHDHAVLTSSWVVVAGAGLPKLAAPRGRGQLISGPRRPVPHHDIVGRSARSSARIRMARMAAFRAENTRATQPSPKTRGATAISATTSR